jgi:hypothetical protein
MKFDLLTPSHSNDVKKAEIQKSFQIQYVSNLTSIETPKSDSDEMSFLCVWIWIHLIYILSSLFLDST